MGAREANLGGLPIASGDVLLDKYRVERLIGEGGTSVVLLATHLQRDQRVAIKFLRPALASDELRTRFKREARAMATLGSEHAALVFEAGALDDGLPYMVMEYLDGRDLARVLEEDGPLPVEQAVDCILQVCRALEHAHAAGIVHRDLKPANLFLTRGKKDGSIRVKVVDFGISKLLDKKLVAGDDGPNDVTSARAVLGSPRYMAPEQVNSSRDVDARADLWSVGAVLFRLVTGEHAFAAKGSIEATLAVLTSSPLSLCELAPHAPRELEAIVNRCLTKDVTKRIQTATELAEALRPFASARERERDRQPSAEARSRDVISPSASEGTAEGSSRDAPTVRKLRISRVPASPISTGTDAPVVAARRSSSRIRPPRHAVALGLGAVVAVAGGILAYERVTARHPPAAVYPSSAASIVLPSSAPVLLDAGKTTP